MAGRIEGASVATSSRYTADLSELIISKYAYMTEEQRAKEFGRIIGKVLRNVAKEKGIVVQKQKKEVGINP